MGGLFLIVLAASAFFEKPPKPEAAPATLAAAPATPETSATVPVPGAADAEALKGVKADVDGLAKQLKELLAKFDSLPRTEPAPDLKTVQGKLDELTKAVEPLGPLSEKVGKLDERVGGLDEGLKSVRGAVADLKGEIAKVAETAKTDAAPRPAAEIATPADAAAYTQGTDLFKAGKYKESADALKKLAATDPKDARVYYFAALANGAATGEWRGETERLVTKGVELEKAGAPKVSEIDNAFNALPPAAQKMKAWLDYYRKAAH
jgi:TolA-binding protein